MRSSSLSRNWQTNQGIEIRRVLAKTSNWLDNIVFVDGDANEDDDEDDEDDDDEEDDEDVDDGFCKQNTNLLPNAILWLFIIESEQV